MFRLFCLLLGYTRIFTDSSERTLNLLYKSNTVFFGQKGDENGVSFCVLSITRKKTVRMLLENAVTVTKCENFAGARLWERYRGRIGIAIGLIIFLFTVYASENIVWRIDVRGNERVSDREIYDLLEKYGVYEGAPCKKINSYETANLCLLENKELSYMSINMIGSCIDVVVSEKKSIPPGNEGGSAPSSIIALRSGRITEMEVYSGSALVSVGDTVFAGQPLVSGMYSYSDGRYSFVRSSARIFAQTMREFSVRVPLREEVKEAKEEKTLEKSVFFFTKEIKILKNSRKSDSVCDTIERNRRVMLFGRIALPLYVREICEVSYSERELTLSKEQALARARAEMGELLSDYELLSYSEESYTENGEIVLKVLASVNEDIAYEIGMIGNK